MLNQKVQLTDEGANLFPIPTMVGIDTTNLIASGGKQTYTAIQDCVAFIFGRGSGVALDLYLDGKRYAQDNGGPAVIYMKKGQTYSISNEGMDCAIYGLKY